MPVAETDPELPINLGALSANQRYGFDFENGKHSITDAGTGTVDARTPNMDVYRVKGFNDTAATLLLEANGAVTYISAQQPIYFEPGGPIRQMFMTPDAATSANKIRLVLKGPNRTRGA